MLIKPRPYQTEAVDSIFDYLDRVDEGNGLIAMPTGTGKSVVIGSFCERALGMYPDLRVQCVTHVQELVEQNHAKLIGMWPLAPAGICSAGLGRKDMEHQITFGSIGSMYKHAAKFGHVNTVLVDEAHMVGTKEAGMYRRYFQELREINPSLRIIGLSATIFRMGLGLLTEGDLFTHVCYDITGMAAFNKLVADGYLCPLRARPTDTQFDLSRVKTVAGEFNQRDLQEAMDVDAKTRQALLETIRFGEDRRSWLIFASGVEHALHVADMLNGLGIPTGAVHGNLPDDVRALELARFKNGTYRAMVNNNILTTGFDHPGTDLIAVLRATKSANLHVQMLGRGTRPSEGKPDCLVLDFVGNTERLGPINDPVIPRKKGTRAAPGVAPVRLCDTCGYYVHASARSCPHCDTAMPVGTFGLGINSTASTAAPMREDNSGPLGIDVQTFEVTRVLYDEHESRRGFPPSLRVVYYCGMRRFMEWVCFEHTGNVRNLARKWWRQRMRVLHGDIDPLPEPPETVAEIVNVAHYLPMPKTIQVHYNKKPHPEVLGYEFGNNAEAV